MTSAGQRYWDGYFARLASEGTDLDWGGRWTDPFIPLLERHGAHRVLELGCGTGNDAARLASHGLDVLAMDLSPKAIERARSTYGDAVGWTVADITRPLPVESSSFDAVMANVALHMFPDVTTRVIFAEIKRVLRPEGLFLFHVNAHDDRALRERRRPVERELEPDYVLEKSGQTVRFFSRDYLVDLLSDYEIILFEHVEIPDEMTGEAFKRVWRVAARTPPEGDDRSHDEGVE